MKIHLISDQHIEGGYPEWDETPNVEADVCVLAGDVCTIRKDKALSNYLLYMKNLFPEVIFVNGNHEFYGSNYKKSLAQVKQIADDAGVHLMDIHYGTENLILDGVTFWGSTLWMDFKDNDWCVKKIVRKGINDFFVINGFNVDKAYNAHIESIERMNWNADVVVTHHMPILRKHSKFPINSITYGFCCTTLEEKIADSNIKYWLYGHTHDNKEFTIGDTIVVSNQTGYRTENVTKPYDPNFLIEV